ncbi:hypothetical protein ACIQK5_05805 [Streptomyces virginiae]|uniref:hypothetical protein n=1 Tax=Streptomyces virginiae TaxID=1961 RepID=UPI00136A83A8|nr:hypothetical protein [Streptomyces sp. SID1046]
MSVTTHPTSTGPAPVSRGNCGSSGTTAVCTSVVTIVDLLAVPAAVDRIQDHD